MTTTVTNAQTGQITFVNVLNGGRNVNIVQPPTAQDIQRKQMQDLMLIKVLSGR